MTSDTPDFAEAVQELLLHTSKTERFIETMRTLAIEYQDKAITPERYAQRVYAETVALLRRKA